MNARGLAVEAVSYYFSHVDVFRPHTSNVQNHLRAPVIAVTQSILDQESLNDPSIAGASPGAVDEGGIVNAANVGLPNGSNVPLAVDDAKKSSVGSNWRKYLGKSSGSFPDTDRAHELYGTLGRRTKARLEAFLSGVTLAVPVVEEPPSSLSKQQAASPDGRKENHLPKLPTTATAPTTVKRKKKVESSTSTSASGFLSVREGLAGPSTPSGAATPNSYSSSRNSSPLSSPVLSSLNASSQSLIRTLSGGSQSAPRSKCPQIREEELVIRFELYIRCLYRVKAQGQECVVAAEPVRALKARARSVVAAFIDTVGTVRQQSPVLTRLLYSLTMELLAVDVMGEDLVQVIRRLVSDYEHCTSFASLAFLSSPESAAENRLTPMVLKYLRYLQSNCKACESSCELERMLTLSLDAQLRYTFKNIEFQSIGHLLEVCHGFQRELQHIQLAPWVRAGADEEQKCNADVDVSSAAAAACGDEEAVRQAIRDLRREVITVNGHVLPPVTSRTGLIDLLSQTLNSRALSTAGRSSRTHHRKSYNHRHQRGSSSKSSKGSIRRIDSAPCTLSSASSGDSADEGLSSGNEADMSGNDLYALGESKVGGSNRRPRRRSFNVETVDLLTRRILLAACRTGTGGDAYFIVRDLFGGEDVEVVPSQSLPTHGRAIHPTIEIMVRLANVTIKCHGSFDVYPKSLIGECEPLIQIHTSTTETICLQEVRANDGTSTTNSQDVAKRPGAESDDDAASSGSTAVTVVQERKTDKTGWRTLSVRLAMYEKVEEWNTPS